MKHLDGLLNVIDSEFAVIESNGKFKSKDDVELVYKLVDIAKDVYEIWKCEDMMDSGYSETGMNSYRGYPVERGRDGRSYRGGGSSRDGGSYRDGASYRGGISRRGYSRDDGNEECIENLRDIMREAQDENTRKSIQRMITQMEQDR